MSKQDFTRLEVQLGISRVACVSVMKRADKPSAASGGRVLRGLRQDGPASLVSKRRGRPRNHRLPAEVRTQALSIVRARYADFGRTSAFAGQV